MSGGHFDYGQWHIQDIAENIDKLLEDIAKPRPPQHLERWVSVKEQIGEDAYHCDGYMYNTFHDCKTVEEAMKIAKRSKMYEVEDGHVYDAYDTWTDEDGNVHRCELFFKECEAMEYNEGYEETHYYGTEYSPKTIEEFKKGRDLLRKAYIYAQRIDWLLSCDDGEDTFHERLKRNLESLEKDGDLRNV